VLAPHVGRGDARLALAGPLERADALAAALSRALAEAGRRLVVELDGAGYLADELAAVLRRAIAAAGEQVIELHATRPGPRRWLKRHGFIA
jgi:hypothetical protein